MERLAREAVKLDPAQQRKLYPLIQDPLSRGILASFVFAIYTKHEVPSIPPEPAPFALSALQKRGFKLRDGKVLDYRDYHVADATDSWQDWNNFLTAISATQAIPPPLAGNSVADALNHLAAARKLRKTTVANIPSKDLVWTLGGFSFTAHKFRVIRGAEVLHYGSGTVGASTRTNYDPDKLIEVDPLTPYGHATTHSKFIAANPTTIYPIVVSDVSAYQDVDHVRSMSPEITNRIVAEILDHHYTLGGLVYFEAKIGLALDYPAPFHRHRWTYVKPRLHNAEIVITMSEEPNAQTITEIAKEVAPKIVQGNAFRMQAVGGAKLPFVRKTVSRSVFNHLIDVPLHKPPVHEFRSHNPEYTDADEM